MRSPDRSPDATTAGHLIRTVLAWTARCTVLALSLASGLAIGTPWGPLVDGAVGLLLGVALLGLGHGIYELLAWSTRGLARGVGSGTVAALAAATALLIGFLGLPVAAAATLVLVGALAFGGVVAMAVAIAGSDGPLPLRVAVAAAGLALSVGTVGWWFWPGGSFPTGTQPPVEAVLPITVPGEPDPTARRLSEAGPHPVGLFAYGSGTPRFASAFGRDASVSVPPLDLSDLVTLHPVVRALRGATLGHGLDAVPRNAHVWFPAGGVASAPLVLIAHGNASLFVASADGYGTLGRHLASHGYVVASIDASAFGELPVVGGLRGENDARALLMLGHLDAWSSATLRPGAPG
ncbi:MAG: hypothetical protein WD336_00670, partial [Trueperaceae bacterium]